MDSRTITNELRLHAPFTTFGTITGIVTVVLMLHLNSPRWVSVKLFWTLHPIHALLSALATAGMYRCHGNGVWWQMILIGFLGSIGIATLSDCIIPYLGELLLGLPHRGIHIGVIEKWWLVNPLAAAGIALAYL